MLKASDLYESARSWLIHDPSRALRLAYACDANIGEMDVQQCQVDNLIGTCYTKEPLIDPTSAIYYFNRAVAADKKCPQFKANLAHALMMDGKPEAAEVITKAALVDFPEDRDLFLKNFNSMLHQGRFREVMQIQEDDCKAHEDGMSRMCLGLTQLTNSDIGGKRDVALFHKGVKNYAGRVDTFGYKVQGDFVGIGDISGRDIIILLEQGLGDCVMMIPYIQLAARYAKSIDICSIRQDAAIDLYRTMGCFERYPNITFHKSNEDTDNKKPMLWMFDLMAYGMPHTLWDIRTEGTYGNKNGKIGICWRGNPDHPNDWYRSMRLKDIDGFVRRNGKNLVCLQSNLTDREHDFMIENGVEIAASIPDQKELIRVLGGLKAVVSVDTFICHMAGALHIPCYLLLMVNTDWRWGISSDRSDWYYNHKIFRQAKACEWSKPLYEVENGIFG